MRPRICLLAVPLAFLLTILLPASPAAGQGRSVEYLETTRIEASGTLGALVAMGDDEEPSRRAVHVLDTRVRMDSDDGTSILFDAASLEWTILMHETQDYMTFTLSDMREMTAQTADAMEQTRSEAEAEMEASREEMEAAMAEAERTMEASVEHVARGESRDVLGYPAERHHVIVTVENADDIQGAENVEDGALMVVLDLWLSPELARENPLYVDPDHPEENPLYQAMMENSEVQATSEEMAEQLEAAFGSDDAEEGAVMYTMVDPRVGAAMEEAFVELSNLEGEAVITTTTVAVVPPTVERDVEVILAWEPESMGDQIQGSASEAAMDAARDAVRGFTRGVFGGDDDEAEVDEEDLIIRPLFRTTTELLDVRRGEAPSPDLFQIPEGYTPREMPALPADPGGR